MKIIKTKFCWVATQTKAGWRLALAIGGKNYNLEGLLLHDEANVKKLFEGGVVFIHLGNTVEGSKPKAKKK